MNVLAIAGTNLRRMARERANFFFVLIFPLLVIALLGAQYGRGFTTRLGVYAPEEGALPAALISALDETDGVTVERYTDQAAMEDDVARGRLHGSVVVPRNYAGDVRAGRSTEVVFAAKRDLAAFALRDVVDAAVASQATLVAAAQARVSAGLDDFDEAMRVARDSAQEVPGVAINVERVGEGKFVEFARLGQYDLGASQQLLLFTFLTSLTAAAALIQVRRLGISRRMLSTPASTASILLGEGAGRFAVALVQSLYIMVGTQLLFGVNWGAPLGALAIVVTFSLASAGAAMLIGSVMRNDAQAAGIGMVLGLGLAALGGAMVPLDFLSPTLQRIAHITPHAWAMDGFTELVRHGGGLADIGPQLGVLTAYAVALLALATWRLHRALVDA